jgi:Fe2+ transport system protein FeoA
MVDASHVPHSPAVLSALHAGAEGVVASLDPAVASALEDVGIAVGTVLVVEHRIPLGGPIVVRVGTARVALGRPIAKGVRVTVGAPSSSAPAEPSVA